MEQPRIVPMDASFFDCAFCLQAMKPPTFKCLVRGHVMCQDCRASHIHSGCCVPCQDTSMDRFARAAMVTCDHKDLGCTVRVPYYDLADHLRCCDFVPCQCPSRTCPFSVLPAALPQHFSEHHWWDVVHGFVYGQVWELAVPDPDCMVALVGEADGRVFVLYAIALATGMAVSVVCMRASEDAPEVAHQFHCELWVQGAGRKARKSFRVTSSDGSRLPGNSELFLSVPERLLQQDDESGEPPALMICIEKDGGR